MHIFLHICEIQGMLEWHSIATYMESATKDAIQERHGSGSLEKKKEEEEEEQEWAPKTKNKSIPNEEKRMNSDMGCSKRGDGES